MKTTELRDLTKEEILNKIELTQIDLGELKFKHSMNQLENPMLIRQLRREVARMKTIAAEK